MVLFHLPDGNNSPLSSPEKRDFFHWGTNYVMVGVQFGRKQKKKVACFKEGLEMLQLLNKLCQTSKYLQQV